MKIILAVPGFQGEDNFILWIRDEHRFMKGPLDTLEGFFRGLVFTEQAVKGPGIEQLAGSGVVYFGAVPATHERVNQVFYRPGPDTLPVNPVQGDDFLPVVAGMVIINSHGGVQEIAVKVRLVLGPHGINDEGDDNRSQQQNQVFFHGCPPS